MFGVEVPEINIIISVTTSIMALCVALYAWTRRHVQGAYWFAGLVAAISWVTFWYALEASSAYDVNAYVTFSKFEYIGLTFIPLFWLGFAISHGGKARPFSNSTLRLLVAIPIVTIALAFTNDWHGLIWKVPAFERGSYGPIFSPIYGTWFWVYTIYAYLIFIAGTVVLIGQVFDLWDVYRTRAVLILVGTALPWLSNLVEIFDSVNPTPELYLNAAFLGAGIISFAFALFRLHLLGVMPLAYSTVLNSVPDGLIVTDMRNRVVAMNQNAKHYLHDFHSDPTGKPFDQVLPSFPIEMIVTKEDGMELRWQHEDREIDVRLAAVHGHTDDQRGWLFVLSDVTMQMQTQVALRQSQRHLDAFFAQALDGFFFMMLDEPVRWNESVDKDAVIDYVFTHQRITRANDALLEQYRVPHDRVIGMTPDELFADELETGKALWRQLFDHGHIQLEMDRMRFDGSIMSVEGQYICLYDEEGRITGHFGIQRDVTGRNQNLRALREAEHRYRALFEQSNDAVFILNFEGQHQQANQKAADMLGYTVQEIQHLGFKELSAEPVRSEGILQRLLTGGHVPPYERVFRRKDGTEFPVEINVELVRDENNQPLHIQSIVRDISERKAAEEQLHLQSAALESAANAILITDHNGIIEWSNPAFTTLTGFTAAEALGQSPRDLIRSGVHDEAFYADMWNTILSGQTWEGQIVNQRKDGSLYTEEQVIAPVRDARAQISHFIAIKQDITERLHAQQEAFKMALEKERIEMLAQFIQDTSHEFRTPLSIIQSNLYLINRIADPEGRALKAKGIEEQVERINRLVDMLVQMSRIDSGFPFTLHATDLNMFMQDIATHVQPKLSLNTLLLKLELEKDLPNISVDRRRLVEAIEHIVDNAMRYTPPDGTVVLRTLHDDNNVFIEVEDSGIGIGNEAMPHIFERFFRDDPAHTTPGFGLGLPIAQGIIHRHGGTIEVNSEVGAGSTFRIVLPNK